MGRTIQVKGFALAAIFSALACSSPGAEEIEHHGVMADSESNAYECLSCHDGQVGAPVQLSTKVGKHSCDHPVNRDYPPAKKQADYLPLESVTDAGIKLLNGQVTCISCHNLKSPEKDHLAVPLDNSNLCFSCHKI